jgi:hypothetical protein
MTDQVSQNAAIAFMISKDREAELRALFEGRPKARTAKASQPKKARTPKAEKEVTVPKKPFDQSKMFLLPAGSVGAEGYLKMARQANTLREKQEAIAAYTGYDIGMNFAEQEYRASAQAKKELKPEQIRETVRATTAGYVAGMPKHGERHRGNLKARERMAVEEIIVASQAAETATDPFEQRLQDGLVSVGYERLDSIRADLRGAPRINHRQTLIGIPEPAVYTV